MYVQSYEYINLLSTDLFITVSLLQANISEMIVYEYSSFTSSWNTYDTEM